MSLLLAPIIEVFRLLVAPVAPFTWFGLPLSTLDTVAAFRLCVALRQFREKLARDHALKMKTTSGEKGKEVALPEIESRSFMRDAAATLVVVYGGEAIMGASSSFNCILSHLIKHMCSSGTGDTAFLHALWRGAGLLYCHSSNCRAALLGSYTLV